MTDRRRLAPLPGRMTRRRALELGAAAVASTVVVPQAVSEAGAKQQSVRNTASTIAALQPEIRPRSDWAGELGVKGTIVAEDDVRFLLVHHTASSNDYTPEQVVDQIRGFYEFHTGPEKGWPDVAYNFFVDRFGGIWEARQGSIDGPVRGDATGGSQGFALLCSLIGNHVEEPTTPEAEASLVSLLAWLGARYAIDTTPGSTVEFISRGSSRHPEGSAVTATTIAGHRDMSTTSCPGDFVYNSLGGTIATAVTDRRAEAGDQAVAGATTTSSTVTTASTTSSTAPPSSTPPTETQPSTSPSSSASQPSSELAVDAASGPSATDDGDSQLSVPLIVAGGIAAAVAAVGAVLDRLRTRRS